MQAEYIHFLFEDMSAAPDCFRQRSNPDQAPHTYRPMEPLPIAMQCRRLIDPYLVQGIIRSTLGAAGITVSESRGEKKKKEKKILKVLYYYGMGDSRSFLSCSQESGPVGRVRSGLRLSHALNFRVGGIQLIFVPNTGSCTPDKRLGLSKSDD